MSVFVVAIVLVNIAFSNNGDKLSQPVPEVIACESQGNCQMTRIEVLLQQDKKEQQHVNIVKKNQVEVADSD